MTDEVVARLHGCLVEELRKREHPPDQPLKVSEIYQDLVPYHAVRSRLRVELNADYEHALLRLLAGEHGLLRLEPEEARQDLEREVAEAYPYVGLFRQFPASDVWVSLPVGDGPAGVPEPGQPVSRPSALNDTPSKVDAPSAIDTPAAVDTPSAVDAPSKVDAPSATDAPSKINAPPAIDAPAADPPLRHRLAACGSCDAALPAGRRVRFCPFCGAGQGLRHCPRCDAVLEPAWHHCVRCGHEQPPGTGSPATPVR